MSRCRSSSRNCRRSTPSWSRTSCRRRSPMTGVQRVLQTLLARARLDPRPRHDPGRHRGGGRHHSATRATSPSIVRPRLARQICAQYSAPRRPAADHHAFARAGRRPSPSRSSARATNAISRCSPRRLHGLRHHGARPVRGRRAAGRDAGARHLSRRAALRALDHRALPPRDAGDVAGRDPSPRAAEDRRQRLSGFSRLRSHRLVSTPPARSGRSATARRGSPVASRRSGSRTGARSRRPAAARRPRSARCSRATPNQRIGVRKQDVVHVHERSGRQARQDVEEQPVDIRTRHGDVARIDEQDVARAERPDHGGIGLCEDHRQMLDLQRLHRCARRRIDAGDRASQGGDPRQLVRGTASNGRSRPRRCEPAFRASTSA